MEIIRASVLTESSTTKADHLLIQASVVIGSNPCQPSVGLHFQDCFLTLGAFLTLKLNTRLHLTPNSKTPNSAMSSVSLNYSPPVSELLTYEEIPTWDSKWPDYRELGLKAEHIPELIRMIGDEDLYQSDPESLESWSPIHAWRALAQLQAEEAIEPLLGIVSKLDDLDEEYWEWISEEMPMVFQGIGVETIPFLANYLSDSKKGQTSRINIVETLSNFAESELGVRETCIALLTEQLRQFDLNADEVNGFIVVALADLKALESVAIIEEAFEKGCVDERVGGDWEDIQVLLGLKPARERPRNIPPLFLDSFSSDELAHQAKKAKTQEKKKRKMQKEARRKNRPKKKK